jgi:hypothetical protein
MDVGERLQRMFSRTPLSWLVGLGWKLLALHCRALWFTRGQSAIGWALLPLFYGALALALGNPLANIGGPFFHGPGLFWRNLHFDPKSGDRNGHLLVTRIG